MYILIAHIICRTKLIVLQKIYFMCYNIVKIIAENIRASDCVIHRDEDGFYLLTTCGDDLDNSLLVLHTDNLFNDWVVKEHIKVDFLYNLFFLLSNPIFLSIKLCGFFKYFFQIMLFRITLTFIISAFFVISPNNL